MRNLVDRLWLIDSTARNGAVPPSKLLPWIAEEASAAYPQAHNLIALASACLHQLSTDADLDQERYAILISWLRRTVEQETGDCTSADGVFEEWRDAA